MWRVEKSLKGSKRTLDKLFLFAECQEENTRQTTYLPNAKDTLDKQAILPRVITLPSTFYEALGKERKITLGKLINTRQTQVFSMATKAPYA